MLEQAIGGGVAGEDVDEGTAGSRSPSQALMSGLSCSMCGRSFIIARPERYSPADRRLT
jgi:hypothetical protein